MPESSTTQYYLNRKHVSLVMADASCSLATRKIHLEMAKQYEALANTEADAVIAMRDPLTAVGIILQAVERADQAYCRNAVHLNADSRLSENVSNGSRIMIVDCKLS